MKKILIIGVVLCTAIAAHAAAFNWSTKTTGKIYNPGTTTTFASGTAYLFADTGTTAQAAIFAELVAGNDISGKALDSNSISAGGIAKKATTFSYDGDITAYFAIVDGDNFFIGPTASAEAVAVGSNSISFNAKTASQAALMDSAAGFKGAGWYTASVPEPTSGLLMLLGIAGLALRRRRA